MLGENMIAIRRFFLASFLAFVCFSAASAIAQDKVKLVVFGDSLVAGYGLPPGAAFPERLQSVLVETGMNVDVINAGVSGDTTTSGLARLEWSIPTDADIIIVELGANDALRGIPLKHTRKNLAAIIEKLQARGQTAVLAGMLAPPNMGEDYGLVFKKIYRDLSIQYQVPLYPFFLDGVAAQPHLNLSDGIHPNEAGVDEIVHRFLPFFEMIINEL